MVPGISNTYVITPLAKMVITPLKVVSCMGIDSYLPQLQDAFSVLYNPQSYTMQRHSMPDEKRRGKISQQFPKHPGSMEMLEVDFFLDTFSAGTDVIGIDGMKPFTDGLFFAANGIAPSYTKMLDVREYVNKLYDLCLPNEDTHAPRPVKLSWGSLSFICYMRHCQVEYTKFKETGVPVRAKVHCMFTSAKTLEEIAKETPFNSPDTSKFHTVQERETLEQLASKAYDDPSQWRVIARANGITNPRLLNTGSVLHMPAIVD